MREVMTHQNQTKSCHSTSLVLTMSRQQQAQMCPMKTVMIAAMNFIHFRDVPADTCVSVGYIDCWYPGFVVIVLNDDKAVVNFSS